MVAELNHYFSEIFPEEFSVFLMLDVPLKNVRETKKRLINEVERFVRLRSADYEIDICGNRIAISRMKRTGCSVAAGRYNRFSSAKITESVKMLLADRIAAKSVKVRRARTDDEYWLALFNHYWVARADSYRAAYKSLALRHEFDKIYLVTEYGEAELIS